MRNRGWVGSIIDRSDGQGSLEGFRGLWDMRDDQLGKFGQLRKSRCGGSDKGSLRWSILLRWSLWDFQSNRF